MRFIQGCSKPTLREKRARMWHPLRGGAGETKNLGTHCEVVLAQGWGGLLLYNHLLGRNPREFKYGGSERGNPAGFFRRNDWLGVDAGRCIFPLHLHFHNSIPRPDS